MGKKYIIELPENTHWIQWLMEGTEDHHPYMDFKSVEDLTPYTGPDLDKVKADAYNEGLKDGQAVAVANEQNNAFNDGYKKCLKDMEQVRKEAYYDGYKAGMTDNSVIIVDDKLHKAYQEGLSDAWEAARRIGSNSYCSLEKMGFKFEPQVVGYNPSWYVVKNYSASEAIEKIRQYEQEQEKIKRGDEVIAQSGETIVVTCPLKDDDLGWLDGMGLDGRVYSFLEKNCTKTGKHYSEIAEFFRKMREAQE